MRPSNQAQALILMYYRRAQHDFKELNENRRRLCIYHIPYIIPLFQNFKKSPKIQK